MQHCVLDRVLLSPIDAVYCTQYAVLLNTLEVRTYTSTAFIFNLFFSHYLLCFLILLFCSLYPSKLILWHNLVPPPPFSLSSHPHPQYPLSPSPPSLSPPSHFPGSFDLHHSFNEQVYSLNRTSCLLLHWGNKINLSVNSPSAASRVVIACYAIIHLLINLSNCTGYNFDVEYYHTHPHYPPYTSSTLYPPTSPNRLRQAS